MAKSQGKKSKKDRQHSHNIGRGKYSKQYYRTYKNKEKAWKKHLTKHPHDHAAKADIGKARETIKTSK